VTGEADLPRDATAALFDLDGTLIDTRPGVRAAIAAAFTEVVGSAPPQEQADLSLPLDQMIAVLDPAAPDERRRLVSDAFRRHYDAADWRSAVVYEGADESLRALGARGVRMFVVTNKRTTAATRLLKHFGLAHHFEALVGQPDSGAPRSKVDLTTECMSSADLDPATAVLIGDSNQDAAAAHALGLVFVAVTSGAGPLGHATDDEQRVEVASLADATQFVLGRTRGEDF
jgi:phosphoglycolate phosphatase-like HAD superfamily hydrolase